MVPSPVKPAVLTPEEQKRRRQRSLAIAWALGGMALLFFAVTIVKLGPQIMNRPL